MTEEQAMKCWCPFAISRVLREPTGPGEEHVATYRLAGETHPRTGCVASACMAWRWSSDFNVIMERHPEADTPAEIKSYAHGFCGLAGKPE